MKTEVIFKNGSKNGLGNLGQLIAFLKKMSYYDLKMMALEFS